MAYIRPHKDGYRVEVKKVGHQFRSQVCRTKAEARAWGVAVEAEMVAGAAAKWPRKTVTETFERYAQEVSSTKDGAAKERLRLAAFVREFPVLAGKIVSEVQPADLAAWRDARLRSVAKASVQRDINLLRHVWTVAIKEWRLTDENPWSKIRMPGNSPHRERVASWREIKAIMRRCGYITGQAPKTGLHAVAWAFLVALRTGMRAGEIMGLTVDDVRDGVATIEQHKTRHITQRVKRVPLNHRGRVLLNQLMEDAKARGEHGLWIIGSKSLDTLFRKARDSIGIKDLHFHESRATFATHAARRVDALTLSKILGHGDIRNTLIYYRETEIDIAKRLLKR